MINSQVIASSLKIQKVIQRPFTREKQRQKSWKRWHGCWKLKQMMTRPRKKHFFSIDEKIKIIEARKKVLDDGTCTKEELNEVLPLNFGKQIRQEMYQVKPVCSSLLRQKYNSFGLCSLENLQLYWLSLDQDRPNSHLVHPTNSP